MIASPDKLLAALVTIAACLLCMAMAVAVARVRNRLKVPPPAMSGPPELERTLRVHGNTVENLSAFLAMLWLATIYFQGWLPGILGAVWVIGRVIYMIGYCKAVEKRGPGFAIAQLSQLALTVLAAIGVINAWMAASA